jgi:hypothetical protein
MKDSRIGETLWSQWLGNSHHAQETSALIYVTEEHVDINVEVVRRALASAIQRDGIVDSLGQAFSLLDGKTKNQHAFAGHIDGDPEPSLCDKDGLTMHGDSVEEVLSITLVDINV